MKAKATNWAEMLPFFRLGIGGRICNGRQWMSWTPFTLLSGPGVAVSGLVARRGG